MPPDRSRLSKAPPAWKVRLETFHQRHPVPSEPSEIPLWRSRGYLPHFERAGVVQSITIRLADALPSWLPAKWQEELRTLGEEERERELRIRIEKYLDAGHGACWLGRHDVGRLVETALLFFDEQRYRLIAWCVMPNHVHIVVETVEGWTLGQLAHSWKSYTSKEANRFLQRTGVFWQREYYDRAVRDAEHYANLVRYVEQNPVKAGLVACAEGWPFSSARLLRRVR